MRTIRLILKEIAGAPDEFQLLPDGTIEIEGDDPAYMDEAAASLVIAAFKSHGNDMVIDYEHQTLADGQAPAAGWIRDLVWKGKQGLWAAKTEWTKRAKEYLENREYRFFSPVMLVSPKDGRVMRMLNIALTNSPRIKHLQPIVAKWDAMETSREKEVVMIGKLRKMLGLADDAGEDKVLEAVTLSINKGATVVACKEVLDALGAKPESAKDEVVRIVSSLKGGTVVACKEVLDALGAKADAGKEDVLRIVASLKAPGNAAVELGKQVTELTARLSKMEQDDLITLALKEGKTSPDELEKWGRALAKDAPEQFKLIVLSRPAGSVIPLSEIVVAKDLPGAVSSDVQQQVNRMMGIDDATFKKYNK
jgi:phage I-like protein